MFAVTVIVHVAFEPLHAVPDQPVKIEAAPAVAVSVTSVFGAYDSEQSVPQSMPVGAEVTVPLPEPLFATVTVGRSTKLALTDRASLIVKVQVFELPVQAPDHPSKCEFADAVAVSVTVLPPGNDPLQSVGQLTPAGLDCTVPVPVPATNTVTGIGSALLKTAVATV